MTFILALYHSHDSTFRQVRCFQKSAKCFQIVLPVRYSVAFWTGKRLLRSFDVNAVRFVELTAS